jgi:hypothetical protein
MQGPFPLRRCSANCGRLERIPRFVTACTAEGSPPSCRDRHRIGARGTWSLSRTHLRSLPQGTRNAAPGRPRKTYSEGTGLWPPALPVSRLGFSECHLEYHLASLGSYHSVYRWALLRMTKNYSAGTSVPSSSASRSRSQNHGESHSALGYDAPTFSFTDASFWILKPGVKRSAR